MRTQLQRLGVLRESGHEHMSGSIAVPIFDEQGAVLEMYGRKITLGLRPGTPLHMYLSVSEKGVTTIEEHLVQFGDWPENTAMVGRLRSAPAEGRKISGADASFYMHEVAEATMMGRGMAYETAHAAALTKYQVSPFSVYAREVVAESQHFSSSPGWVAFWGL